MPGAPLVILTQEETDNRKLARQLANHGVASLSYPCIAIRMLPFDEQLLPAGRSLATYRIVAFTSKRGVAGMAGAASQLRQTAPAIACVGAATASAVRELLGLEPQLIERDGTGTGLARAIAERYPAPIPLLLVRGSKTTGTLQDGLRQLGWAVDEVVVYEHIAAAPPQLDAPAATVAVFASPSAAEGFASANPGLLARLTCVAIGSTTAARLRELGATSVKLAGQPTQAALVTAVCQLLEEAATP